MSKFKVGDKVRFSKNDPYLYGLSEIVAARCSIQMDAVHTVIEVNDERGFVSTDLIGGPWQDERFELVNLVEPHPYMFGDIHDETSDALPPEWKTSAADPDLKRPGYHEECSEYRACTNENGDWVIEATRRKIIAQAADEQEAHRIAAALNINTVTY